MKEKLPATERDKVSRPHQATQPRSNLTFRQTRLCAGHEAEISTLYETGIYKSKFSEGPPGGAFNATLKTPGRKKRAFSLRTLCGPLNDFTTWKFAGLKGDLLCFRCDITVVSGKRDFLEKVKKAC